MLHIYFNEIWLISVVNGIFNVLIISCKKKYKVDVKMIVQIYF